MSHFIISEAEVSGSNITDDEYIDTITQKEENFINDSEILDNSIDFDRSLNGEKTRLVDYTSVIVKTNIGNLKIESSNSDSEIEEPEIDVCDSELVSEPDEGLPEECKHIYSTDNYGWNDYNQHLEIFEFGEEKYFLFNFQSSLLILSKNNTVFQNFYTRSIFTIQVRMIKTTINKSQVTDGLY